MPVFLLLYRVSTGQGEKEEGEAAQAQGRNFGGATSTAKTRSSSGQRRGSPCRWWARSRRYSCCHINIRKPLNSRSSRSPTPALRSHPARNGPAVSVKERARRGTRETSWKVAETATPRWYRFSILTSRKTRVEGVEKNEKKNKMVGGKSGGEAARSG